MDTTVNILSGLAVGTLVAFLQMRTREYSPRRLRVGVVLTVAGVAMLVLVARGVPVPALTAALVAVGLGVGAALGVARARTMAVWSSAGRSWTRGTTPTAVLWIVGFAVHLGLDLVVRLVQPAGEALSSSSTLLFVGLTLGTQAWVLGRRVPARPVGAVPA